jgi:predicted RNase H-related nuclease YkuK (DUF458 family)
MESKVTEETKTYIERAKEAIRDSSPESSIYIGCDSKRFKRRGIWHARYMTVIIVHKDSSKGCQLFYDEQVLQDWSSDKSPKQRLMNEVMFCVNAALEVLEVIGDRHYEVHLDLNPNQKYKSSVAVKEAVGYVRGQLGVEAKIKPDAFAAMHAADHLVRHAP